MDIPFIGPLLAVLLIIPCPAAKNLRIILAILILCVSGYALWILSYTSKHKRLLMERGQWGTLVLSPEEEQLWKRSDIWHGVIYGAILVLGILYLYL